MSPVLPEDRLAWRHHQDWCRTGCHSQILLSEANAARLDGGAIDLIRDRIQQRCQSLLDCPVRTEMILTATPPFAAASVS